MQPRAYSKKIWLRAIRPPPSLLIAAPRTELDEVNESQHEQNPAPPEGGAQLRQLHARRVVAGCGLIETVREDQHSIDREQQPDKEPDGNLRTVHDAPPLPDRHVENHEDDDNNRCPEPLPFVEGHPL